MGSMRIRVMTLSRALTFCPTRSKTFLESLVIFIGLSCVLMPNDTLLPTWGSYPVPRVMGGARNPVILPCYREETGSGSQG